MSDDKNKSYQDGLYSQPYNGRNWDQWVAGNNARQNAQRSYEDPKPQVSPIQWPTIEPPADSTGTGGGKSLLFLLAVPFIIAGIGIVAVCAVLALFVAPLLRMAEGIIGTTERKSFGAAYLTSVKALSAYGIVTVAAGFLVHLFAHYIFSGGVIGYIASYIDVVFYGLFYGNPIPSGALIGALSFLAPPALAAFAYVLKRDYQTAYSGRRGFLRGMIAGIPLAGSSFALVSFVYALVSS